MATPWIREWFEALGSKQKLDGSPLRLHRCLNWRGGAVSVLGKREQALRSVHRIHSSLSLSSMLPARSWVRPSNGEQAVRPTSHPPPSKSDVWRVTESTCTCRVPTESKNTFYAVSIRLPLVSGLQGSLIQLVFFFFD